MSENPTIVSLEEERKKRELKRVGGAPEPVTGVFKHRVGEEVQNYDVHDVALFAEMLGDFFCDLAEQGVISPIDEPF